MPHWTRKWKSKVKMNPVPKGKGKAGANKLPPLVSGPQRLPTELILRIADHLHETGDLGTMSALSMTNKTLNDHLTPQLYSLLRLRSFASLYYFFHYYSASNIAVPQAGSSSIPLGLSRTFGGRHRYLVSLIKDVEIEVDTTYKEEIEWVQRLIREWRQCRLKRYTRYSNIIQVNSVSILFKDTCPCVAYIDLAEFCKKNTIISLILRSFFASHLNLTVKKGNNHPEYWSRYHNFVPYALDEKFYGFPDGVTPKVSDSVFILNKTSNCYDCLPWPEFDSDRFKHQPGKKEMRPLHIIHPPPLNTGYPQPFYEHLMAKLHHQQKEGYIRLISVPTPPYLDAAGFRDWVKGEGKDLWKKHPPGAWEDLKQEERDRFDGIIDGGMMQNECTCKYDCEHDAFEDIDEDYYGYEDDDYDDYGYDDLEDQYDEWGNEYEDDMDHDDYLVGDIGEQGYGLDDLVDIEDDMDSLNGTVPDHPEYISD